VARGAAVALGLVLAVAPATLRNLAVSGETVFITSHGGLNFYIGNHPEADGTYRAVPGITPDIRGQVDDARRLAEEEAGGPLSAREVDAHWRGRTWDWIAGHPAAAARLFLRKLAYVFSAREITLNYSYAYFSRDVPTFLRGLVVGAGVLVPFGLLGLGLRLRARPAGTEVQPDASRDGFALWALVVPAYALSVALFFVASRYRLPLLVPLSAGAGFALVQVSGVIRRRGSRPLLVYGAVLLPLFVLAFWPHGVDDGRALARADEVVWSIDSGRVEHAQALLERTLPDHPEAPVLLFRAGRALQARGRAADAIPLLERALEADPGRPEVRYTLGQCLFEGGRREEAVPHLRAAFEAGIRTDLAGFDLARALASTGRPAEAAAVLDLLVDLELDRESRQAVARLAVEIGADEVAQRALERTIVEDPADAAAHLNLAVLHARGGRFVEARAEALRALELRPGYPQARALLEQLP
jgi:Flp pilus assembly protein TadD